MTQSSPTPWEIRPLAGSEELAACYRLQQSIWGDDPASCVPPILLEVAQKVGGITSGAFRDGNLGGFVYGISGVRAGAPAHWSHMLGVRAGLRDQGLGRLLKLHQRQRLLELGIERMYWTYDPLEARNAHFNLNRLGADVDSYVRDCYGSGDGSPLHSGIGTDRFILLWSLRSSRTLAALEGTPSDPADVWMRVPEVAYQPADELRDWPALDRLRIEIPSDIQDLRRRDPGEAGAWRRFTREAFETYRERGLKITTFFRHRPTGRCFYGLER